MHEAPEVSRRRFLTWATAAMGAFVATVLGLPLLGYLVSPALKRREASWVAVGATQGFPVGQPKLAEFTTVRRDGWVEETEKKSAWVLHQSSGEFLVFNPRCTHLGCIVNWNAERQLFISPCHNGLFDISGTVMGGPPPRPLDRLEYRVEAEQLVVAYKDFRLGVPQKEEV